ncbi:hypothetical protein HPB51_017687 [Rhipicephalus microplus]|uniref:Pseudouridine synthase RsuA/RluA-like domain-containing protein n=1 Tax=Rhipicephalus microplus TaxID=6941 RepID=A0A9J6E343_RHIMP|nr:hypothetical protein HPB51_017687 [Rhipicephalus microplus]
MIALVNCQTCQSKAGNASGGKALTMVPCMSLAADLNSAVRSRLVMVQAEIHEVTGRLSSWWSVLETVRLRRAIIGPSASCNFQRHGKLLSASQLVASIKQANPVLRDDTEVRVLHCSAHFLVVDKPADLVINTQKEHEHPVSVESLLRRQLPELVDPSVEHGFRFCHRLDFATSGVLCLALTRAGARAAQPLLEPLSSQDPLAGTSMQLRLRGFSPPGIDGERPLPSLS